MHIWHAIVLGIIQGLTEFLPISSDGHLVVADVLLNLPLGGQDALGFDILLHAGSVLAILIVYFSVWKQLITSALAGERNAWIVIGLLVVATIPGVIAGLLLEDIVSNMRSLQAAGLGFLATALILITGERIGRKLPEKRVALHNVGVWRAVMIGCAQAVAILPGVSRSGSTISIGRALGLERTLALDLSFLMALPIIAGAVAKTLVDALRGEVLFPSLGVSLTGLVVSFIMSMCAIALLRVLVVKRSLAIFAWYLIPLGTLLVLLSFR